MYEFDYPKFEELNPANCRQVSMQIHYPEFCEYLREHYAGQQLCFAEMIYLFYHELEKPPVCRMCGNKTKFLGYTNGYREFCSHKCADSCKDVQERKKQTSLKNFGTTVPMHCKEVLEKQKRTCQERYGVDNAFQSKELMSKARKTCIEKYGTEYANQSEDVKEKIWSAKFNIALDKYEGILDILKGDNRGSMYTMKCPDRKCTKCQERTFEIRSDVLRSRLRLGADICTRRSPIGAHIKNTTLELFIQSILDENKIVYETNNRKILNGKELDIYIPSKRIAIECNGVYWHAMYDSKYHYEKWKACKEQGIQLLSIWEDWITNKPEIVKSIILSKLGIYEKSIGARECRICTKVKSNEARQFLEANHIQGFCNSTYKYGLYYNDELVALMVFSKENNASKKCTGWTLQRFCNKLNTHVVGGAQRLLTHFCKEHPEGDIVSFAAHDISTGDLYEKIGFKYINEMQANYWYVHNQTHQRFHRSSFMKKDLVRKGYDASLTEEQIMMTTDYLRIFDSGQSKYILYRK